MEPDRTFCRHPLHLSDFRGLPGGGNDSLFLLDRPGAELLYDIQEHLRRLAPMGPDGRRSIWVEALRGDPDEWEDYDRLRSLGEVSDPEDYLALWKTECPDPVAWYEISVSCCRDRHCLLVSDGEEAVWQFVDRADPGPDPLTEPLDLAYFLRPLARYVGRVVQAICRHPARYNRYVERHLPHFKRYGSIARKDLFRILPESRPDLTDGEVGFLARMGESGRPAGWAGMSVPVFLGALQVAREAVSGPVSDGTCLCGSPAAEVPFLSWAEEQDRRHGFDLIYARLSLRPVCGDDGRWVFVVVFSYEAYLEDAVHAAAALSAAGYPVWIQGLEAIFDWLSGEDRVEIQPGWAYSCVGAPEMALHRPYDAESEAQLQALVRAVDWYPLPEVVPDPFQRPNL